MNRFEISTNTANYLQNRRKMVKISKLQYLIPEESTMEEAPIGHRRNQREWTVRFDFGEFPGPHIARAMPNTDSAQQVR